MHDEVAISVELVRHRGSAESLGQGCLKLTGPALHLEGHLLLVGVEVGVLGRLDLLDQRVDGFLDRLVR